MVVAVVAVGVVEVALDEVVGVVAVRDGGVAAAVAVGVSGVMAAASVVGRAAGRMRVVDGDRVLIDVVAVGVVQVAVVEVVDVIAMVHGGVSAAGAVLVGMVRVDVVIAHRRSIRRPCGVPNWLGVRHIPEVGQPCACVSIGARPTRRGSVAAKETTKIATAQSAIVAPGALSAW